MARDHDSDFKSEDANRHILSATTMSSTLIPSLPPPLDDTTTPPSEAKRKYDEILASMAPVSVVPNKRAKRDAM
jgi:hypothetical protein